MAAALTAPSGTATRLGGKRKYKFTPAMDDLVRGAYHQYRAYNRKAITQCARKLGIPRWTINRRARDLGLARAKEGLWSDAEIAGLERWGHLTDAVIQRKLKAAGYSRSVTAIHLKLKRLRIKQNLDGYSAWSLAEAFGVDSHKVTLWIHRKLLYATRRGTERTEAQGGDSYWITHKAVRDFVLRHPDEIDLAKVEKMWFLDLVTDGTRRRPLRMLVISSRFRRSNGRKRMDYIELSGKSEGKGRNGYFWLHSAEVLKIRSDPDGQVLHFDFYPKRRVKSIGPIGPARLLLAIEDAVKLGGFFAETAGRERVPAKIEEGELVCECGYRGAPHLEESGYQVSHELVEIAGNTITARGWDGSSSGVSEEGNAYWLMCAGCGKLHALPPESWINWV